MPESQWIARNSGARVSLAPPFVALSAVAQQNGEIERTAAELIEACGLSSDNRYSSLVRLRARRVHLVPTIRALFEATYDVGLHKAGMPEE